MERLTDVTSRTCNLKTSQASLNATSSPASEDGPMPAALQDGQTTGLSGQDHAHASLFPLQEGDAERPMQGTYGPTFCASSVPAGPLSSWESKLRERLAQHGSPECALIWRLKRMPCGASMSQLTPSERLTSASGSTGWATPTVHGNNNRKGTSETSGDGLATQMHRAGWSTPRASDGEKGGPNSRDGSGSFHLPAQMHRAGWATPCARDHRSARRSQGHGTRGWPMHGVFNSTTR